MKTSWRHLENVFRPCLQKTSSRRLQDILIKTNIFALVTHLQKTSSKRFQDVLIKTNIFALVIRLQDVFKTFPKRLQNFLQRCLQDIWKTFSRCLIKLNCSCQHVFKKSSRRFQDKFKTFSRSTAKTMIYRKICLGHTSEKFMVRVQTF